MVGSISNSAVSFNINEPYLFFLNSFLWFAGGKHYQRITIPIFRLLQNFANPRYFPYILFYFYRCSVRSSGWFVIAVCGSISALLTLCDGKPHVSVGFVSQRASNVELGCLINAGLDKLSNKRSDCRWIDTPWRSCDFIVIPGIVMDCVYSDWPRRCVNVPLTYRLGLSRDWSQVWRPTHNYWTLDLWRWRQVIHCNLGPK